MYPQLRGCHRNPWLVVIWEDFQISNTKRASSRSLELSLPLSPGLLLCLAYFMRLRRCPTKMQMEYLSSRLHTYHYQAMVLLLHLNTMSLSPHLVGTPTCSLSECSSQTAWTGFAFGAFLEKTDNRWIATL